LYYCSAGIGVLNAARKTMARMLGNNEVAFQSAKSQFWVVDAKVLFSLMSILTTVQLYVLIIVFDGKHLFLHTLYSIEC
jgi:hypothetical protein